MAASVVGSSIMSSSKADTDPDILRRGQKRPQSEDRSKEKDLLLLSPTLTSVGLDSAQAEELAGLMMQMALERAGAPASTNSELDSHQQRSFALTLDDVAQATAAACTSMNSTAAGLTCMLCNRFYHQPVTVACGHTFCLHCLPRREKIQELEETNVFAPVPCAVLGCQHLLNPTDDLHVNMPLAQLLRKWFPRQSQCVEKWRNGETYLESEELDRAVEALTEAIDIDSNNWKLRSSRARAFSELGKLEEGLAEAKKCCQLCSSHAELVQAHLFRAKLELRVGEMYDSAISILRSVVLNGSTNHSAAQLLTQVLTKLSMNMVRERRTFAVDGELGRRLDPLIDESVAASRKKTCMPNLPSVFTNCQAEKPSSTDAECPLCCRLFLQPVTTRCGHMFCCACLERALDHRSTCPCCRAELRSDCPANEKRPVTEVAERLLQTVLPQDYTRRQQEYEEEILQLRGVKSDTCTLPIFVCMMTMPGVTCPLRLHEPRYRLMLRRCLQSGTRQFGMCLPGISDDSPPYANTGTLLQIKDVKVNKDGSSDVQAVGTRRFQVLERNMQDGYNVSLVKWIDDELVEDEEEKAKLKKLHDETYKLAHDFFSHKLLARISLMHGPLPGKPDNPQENASCGPDWIWYCLNLCPLNEEKRLITLASTSLKQRLEIVRACLSAYSNPSSVYAFLCYHCMRVS